MLYCSLVVGLLALMWCVCVCSLLLILGSVSRFGFSVLMFGSVVSFKIDCLDDLFDDEVGQLNNSTTFNSPQQHGLSRQDSTEQLRQAFSARTSERHDDQLPVPSVPSTLGGGRKTSSDEERAASPKTTSPAAKKQKTSHERSGDAGKTMMGGRRSKRLLTRRQSSTIRFNNVVQKLHQHNEREWDKVSRLLLPALRLTSNRTTYKQ